MLKNFDGVFPSTLLRYLPSALEMLLRLIALPAVPKPNGRGWTPTDAPPLPLHREAAFHEQPAEPGGGASVGVRGTCLWVVGLIRFCPSLSSRGTRTTASP